MRSSSISFLRKAAVRKCIMPWCSVALEVHCGLCPASLALLGDIFTVQQHVHDCSTAAPTAFLNYPIRPLLPACAISYSKFPLCALCGGLSSCLTSSCTLRTAKYLAGGSAETFVRCQRESIAEGSVRCTAGTYYLCTQRRCAL
jgi:hypothetical protein